MKLNQISTGVGAQSSDALRNLAVAEFMAKCPLSNWLEFYSITGNADTPRMKDGDITAGNVRALNASYVGVTGTPQFGAVALKIYGDMIYTDIALERRGQDIGSQRVLQLTNFAGSLGRYFMDVFLNSEIDASNIAGLKQQIDAIGRKTVYGSVNGDYLPTGNASADRKKQDAFIEALDAQINGIDGGPDVLLMNGAMIARLGTVGRAFISTTLVQDVYSIQHSVTNYKGIPIVNAGYKANNSGLVIPSDETEGNKSDCTSIYLIKFGEAQDVSMATNVGMDVRDLGVVGTAYNTLFEFDIDLAILNSKAVSRLSGIRIAES